MKKILIGIIVLVVIIGFGLRTNEITKNFIIQFEKDISNNIKIEKTDLKTQLTENISKLETIIKQDEKKYKKLSSDISSSYANIKNAENKLTYLKDNNNIGKKNILENQKKFNNLFKDKKNIVLIKKLANCIPDNKEIYEKVLNNNKSIILKKYSYNNMRKTLKILTKTSIYYANNNDPINSLKYCNKIIFLSLLLQHGYSGYPYLIDGIISNACLKMSYSAIADILNTNSYLKMKDNIKDLLIFSQKYNMNFINFIECEKIMVNNFLKQLYQKHGIYMKFFDIANNPLKRTIDKYNNIIDSQINELNKNIYISKDLKKQIDNSNPILKMIIPEVAYSIKRSHKIKLFEELLLNRSNQKITKSKFLNKLKEYKI